MKKYALASTLGGLGLIGGILFLNFLGGLMGCLLTGGAA